jgi:hypothetical protein
MFGSSENDALRAPLNPQQAAAGNAGNPGGIRQQEIGNAGGFTSLSNLSAPATYWQKCGYNRHSIRMGTLSLIACWPDFAMTG